MADIYVDSAGSGTSPYGSWAAAATTFAAGLAVAAAGDRIFVASGYTDSQTGHVHTFPGTTAAPNIVMSRNKTTDVYEAGAKLLCTSTTGIAISGDVVMYGMSLEVSSAIGSNTTLRLVQALPDRQKFVDCNLHNLSTGASSGITIGASTNADPSRIAFDDCSIVYALRISSFGRIEVNGGSVSTSHGSSTSVFEITSANEGINLEVAGVDFSGIPTTHNIVGDNISQSGSISIRDCKMPASWTGKFWNNSTPAAHTVVQVTNCDSGDTNYQSYRGEYAGTVVSETGIYRNSGASDGTTNLSWKMVSTSNCNEDLATLESFEIAFWNETLTSQTLTVHFVFDGATDLDDDEIWMDVSYPGSSTSPLASTATCHRASPVATPSTHATSTETWTGTSGFTNENKQKLAVSFTAANPGWVYARVVLGKASQTIYVCPKAELS